MQCGIRYKYWLNYICNINSILCNDSFSSYKLLTSFSGLCNRRQVTTTYFGGSKVKHLLLSALMLFAPVSIQNTKAANVQTLEYNQSVTTQINNSYSHMEKKVRNAAVKVATHTGHGSGTLVKYKDMILVLTAHHVADGRLGEQYLIQTETEQSLGILIYTDPLNDIAIIYPLKEFRYAKPMKWKTSSTIGEVATDITYSGYPSWHSLLSFRGQIAGYELIPDKGQQIILQTYGYFGSSGSGVYDNKGNLVGILWAVDIQREGIHENIVWVTPIQKLDLRLAIRPLCLGMGNEPKACR